ncbi:hypothetical protein BGZ73_002482, partial [Actinomortierella ambigua]
MDIDNMDIRVAINAIATQVRQMQRNGGFQPKKYGATYPPKLSPQDKAYLVANGGCFRCRKLGHMAND